MSSPPFAVSAEHLLSSSRYRHPGDVIRLISAGLLLACAIAVSWAASRQLLGPAASVPDDLGPADRRRHRPGAGRMPGRGSLGGRRHAAQAPVPAAGRAGRGGGGRRRHRDRIFALFGRERPAALTADLARGSSVAGAAFPAPALFASAAAVVVAAAPWLPPALAPGRVAHAAAGRRGADPGRHDAADGAGPRPRHRGHGGRRGPGDVRRARPADRTRRDRGGAAARGAPGDLGPPGRGRGQGLGGSSRRSRPTGGGCSSRPWARTSATPTCCTGRTGRCGCGTSATPAPPRRSSTRSSARPSSASWPNGPGVSVPGVDRIVRAGDTALLVLEWVDGCSLDRLPDGQTGDDLLAPAVGGGRAGCTGRNRPPVAARRQRDGQPGGQPRIVDFSFSELDRHAAADGPGRGRTARLAGRPDRRTGPRTPPRSARRPGGRAVAAAAAAVALSAATAERSRVTSACSHGPGGGGRRQRPGGADLARVQASGPGPARHRRSGRCRYLVLPNLARTGAAGTPCESADSVWVPVIIAFSAPDLPGRRRLHCSAASPSGCRSGPRC